MPITCHWKAPLQVPSSSACRGDKDGVAVGLLSDPGRGVKSQFSGSPQWSIEGDLRATSLISPSHPTPLHWQVRSLCERPPFRQLQQDRTTSILTDWESGVKKKHHTMKHTIFLQEYKWQNVLCWPPSKTELRAREGLLLCLLVIPLEFLQQKQIKRNSSYK